MSWSVGKTVLQSGKVGYWNAVVRGQSNAGRVSKNKWKLRRGKLTMKYKRRIREQGSMRKWEMKKRRTKRCREGAGYAVDWVRNSVQSVRGCFTVQGSVKSQIGRCTRRSANRENRDSEMPAGSRVRRVSRIREMPGAGGEESTWVKWGWDRKAGRRKG